MSPSKTCSKCGETKPVDDFYRDRERVDGRQIHCAACSLEASRRYRDSHREEIRKRDREGKATEEGRRKAREYYWRNPEPYRLKSLRNKNKQKAADAESRRRAKINGAERIEKIDRAAIYKRDSGRCHICKKHVALSDFHLDHLIPVARGGCHTSDNVAVAHRVCNQRRGADRLPAQLLLLGGSYWLEDDRSSEWSP